MKILRCFLPIFAVCLLAVSCSDDDSNQPQSGKGRLKVSMTDAPADIEAVFVTFSEISAHINGNWVTVRGNPVTIDLMEWNNGKSIVIGDTELDAGHYTQIRLMLTEARIVVDGQTHPLDVPSADQTGLKLVHEFDIVAGSTYELMVDFDVASSIVVTGPKNDPNSYKLKPTLRVVPLAISGSISGDVTNPTDSTIATAKTALGVTVASTIVDPSSGEWMIAFMPAGVYIVTINDNAGRSYMKTGVVVVAGANINIGSVTLQ